MTLATYKRSGIEVVWIAATIPAPIVCSEEKKASSNTEQDRTALLRFCNYMATLKGRQSIRIMLIPYGEALIHSYYRENMIRLAALPNIAGIGCQTNLSFPAIAFLRAVKEAGIDPSKIKLWATFHPEMVTPEQFTKKITTLKQAGVELCAGVVGDPKQLKTIRALRERLPPDIYLFINAMEGLGRPLTEEEKTAFREIDNLFEYDYRNQIAQWDRCNGGKDTLFVNEKGDCYPCPRSRKKNRKHLYGKPGRDYLLQP